MKYLQLFFNAFQLSLAACNVQTNAAHNLKYIACCVHSPGCFKVESLSHCGWTEFTLHSVCVFCCILSWKKPNWEKIRVKQSTQSALCEICEISHHIWFILLKNTAASRKWCIKTTKRVNPLYMQFTTLFFSNNTPKAFQAVWWFEAACFLSYTVHFSSLIPSLSEQSCVWRYVC